MSPAAINRALTAQLKLLERRLADIERKLDAAISDRRAGAPAARGTVRTRAASGRPRTPRSTASRTTRRVTTARSASTRTAAPRAAAPRG
ncbi:MAG: hypothetical protein ACYCYB_04915, partial [Candidatus Dormibacteria bacterium]